MRLYRVLLLMFVVFFIGANAGLALAESPSCNIDKNAAIAKRLLRADDTANVNEAASEIKGGEARVGGLSKLAELASKISPSAHQLANKLWLKSRTHPAQVFKLLRLEEAGVKLDDNPAFLQWFKYVDMYRNKKGYSGYSDDKVFEWLQKTKSGEELATLFQSLRQVSGMKDFAGTMQRYMFARSTFSRSMMNVWLKSRETPNEVSRILRLGDDTLEGNPLLIQWLRYTEMYRATMGANSFSEWQTYRLLLDSKPVDLEIQSATLFQTIKQVPDLKKLGKLTCSRSL